MKKPVKHKFATVSPHSKESHALEHEFQTAELNTQRQNEKERSQRQQVRSVKKDLPSPTPAPSEHPEPQNENTQPPTTPMQPPLAALMSYVAIIRNGFRRKRKKRHEQTNKSDYGSVTVKETKPQPTGSVTVKPVTQPKGLGNVIRKSFTKFPAAYRKQVPQPPKPATRPPQETHVAGIEIPHELSEHMRSGQVVPQDHPLREKAANFVTNVWRKDKREGARMSEKLLGIGEDGKIVTANAKPAYHTMKSEPSLRRLLKRVT